MPIASRVLDADAVCEALCKRASEYAIAPASLRSCLGVALSICRRYTNSTEAFIDAVQTACMAILQCMVSYDTGRGVPFDLYASPYIRGTVLNLLRVKRIPLGPDDLGDFPNLDADTFCPVQACTSSEHEAAVRQFVAGLPPNMRVILAGVFWDGKSQTNIAEELGVSRTSVNKTLRRAMELGKLALAPLAEA
jgi:RNA polymerase sigma factor (sigma-70 family)